MTVTYTNHLDAIVDALKTILFDEFKPVPVIYDEGYENRHLKHGEYIRFWLERDNWISGNTSGETRQYSFQIDFYIEDRKRLNDYNFQNYHSTKAERLKQVLNSNRVYGSTTWHALEVESLAYLSAEEIFAEQEGLENIRAIRLIVNITRSNFW